MSKAISLLLVLTAALNLAASAHAQDAAAGKTKAAMCIGCHNIPGYQSSFPVVHKVPMIAGQGAAYIVSALTAYRKGERKHPTMRAVATSLTDADMADLGAWYEQQAASLIKPVSADAAAPQPPADVAALLAKGACASCHGANYNKPINATYPKIAGQHPDYLAAALQAYATTGNPYLGRANAIMSAQVKQFKSDELKAMARYLGSLQGDLHTVRQSPFK